MEMMNVRKIALDAAIASMVPAVILGLSSCGSDNTGGHDADAGADADVELDSDVGDGGDEPALEIMFPEPPELPDQVHDAAPPVLTPCPEGWTTVSSSEPQGVVTCDPWPESGMIECSGGSAHFVGEDECRAVGTLCPSGDFTEWPDPTPDDRESSTVDFSREIMGSQSM